MAGEVKAVQLGTNSTTKNIPLSRFKKEDMVTPLPAAGDATNLGLDAGTFGTNSAMLKGSDSKAAAITETAVIQLPVPEDYVSGDLTLVLHAGMLTTVSDTTATLDAEAYLSDEEAGVTGGDLVDTAAQSINSLTLADKSFTILGASLSAGDLIEIQITTAVNDGATGTAVMACVGGAKLTYTKR